MAERVVLEGFHAVKHAVRFGAAVDRVVVLDRAKALGLTRSHAPDLVGVFEDRADVVDAAEFLRVIGRSHPTGVGGLAARPDVVTTDRSAPLVLLDNPRNLGNFGAVIRVAAGLGAGGVVSLGDVDPWHPNVLRGSAGLHFALPVGRLDGVGDVEGTVIAFDADGHDLRDVRIPDDAVLAFGSERHGLSDDVRERADLVVSLPMRPKVSSYNLTTSVAMGLYHWELFRRAS
ncbi:TrmH family RNA methyltransferase [Saccharothrix ecbatanensis]|uniref:TrmH family RNA methyltransferase n=1 Tax=Saccharothrix ecbatanensis TaxID=1105145 RepID=A0A7W9M3Z8_9PSEU|nr:TrmH family RNA methyltransferase [Saccharothrix ecbatanensis]MBB5806577.1 TrmH family RNA methyltransferase [Saccharothrix ecbatanensis]